MWSPATRNFPERDWPGGFDPDPDLPASPPEEVRQLHRIAQQALEQLVKLSPGFKGYAESLDRFEHAYCYQRAKPPTTSFNETTSASPAGQQQKQTP